MRSEYVAPLGSTSLIFNFLFARWLLGTKITMLDAVGTLVVILGVVGVIGFGNIRQAGIDEEANMSLSTLQALWARPAWILHLILLETITSLILWLANIGYEIIEEKRSFETSRVSRDEEDTDVEMVLRRGGGRKSHSGILARTIHLLSPLLSSQQKLRAWLKNSIERWSMTRVSWQAKHSSLQRATSNWSLMDSTIIKANQRISLIHSPSSSSSSSYSPVSCKFGLKVYDSTLIVPVLFATYTGSGFINSLIYLHELPHYRTTVLLMIWLCMAVLVIGVCMLSAKRVEGPGPTAKPIGEYSSAADPEGEVQQTAIGREEAVGMVMINAGRPIKQRRAPSVQSHVPELSECSFADSRSVLNFNTQPIIPRNDNPSLNPFDDFEILATEELPDDFDHPHSHHHDNQEPQDEIDCLQDTHLDSYLHQPHLKP
ncbi:hypothetical protein VP01_1613g2 [Puccinia sorghi]|uniref:Uncharacterized protein n=1 Tax=Puccinia sorghi TaxID=27349 RepID=A0A0L6VIX8_9BASI|nr:hypothetical protein VP01_1613g2 [Puccinia sorghi]